MNEQQDGEGAETPHHDSGGGEPTPADPQATKLDMLIQSVANLQTKVSESVNTVQDLNASMMQLKEDFYGSGDEEEENPDYVRHIEVERKIYTGTSLSLISRLLNVTCTNFQILISIL